MSYIGSLNPLTLRSCVFYNSFAFFVPNCKLILAKFTNLPCPHIFSCCDVWEEINSWLDTHAQLFAKEKYAKSGRTIH